MSEMVSVLYYIHNLFENMLSSTLPPYSTKQMNIYAILYYIYTIPIPILYDRYI